MLQLGYVGIDDIQITLYPKILLTSKIIIELSNANNIETGSLHNAHLASVSKYSIVLFVFVVVNELPSPFCGELTNSFSISG